ncbi:hypothetical protein M8A51_23030 [Schlegelella sp. S2-27]|uniref:Glucose-6-phosphate 1-dehydrogenase n=1 Tax=Caldimonas mangrovi TaxID=2944811 RepID=A0ABT0YVT0_9BURK|nr:hypothetical protein [Caldimonas mangrovi]
MSHIGHAPLWYTRPTVDRPITLVTIGGDGDNARRNIGPGVRPVLAGLRSGRAMSPGSWEIAADVKPMNSKQYVESLGDEQGGAASRLNAQYVTLDPNALDGSYQELGSLCTRRDENQIVVWLSTAPEHYWDALSGIHAHFPDDTIVIIEKPPAKDLTRARRLVSHARRLFGNRFLLLDHYWGKPGVIELMVKLSGPFFGATLQSVTEMHVITDEKRLVTGRHRYFDGVGLFGDVFPSHLLNVASAIACERSDDATELPAARALFLKSLPVPTLEEVARNSRRGQYEGFRQEEGADPRSEADTVFALRLTLPSDHPRLPDVPCIFSAGKGMQENRGVVRLRLADGQWVEHDLQKRVRGTLRTHGLLLLAAAAHRMEYFVSPDEALRAMELNDAVQHAWRSGCVPLEPYVPGRMISSDFVPRRV